MKWILEESVILVIAFALIVVLFASCQALAQTHYEGGVRDGKLHGYGVLTMPDGTRREGVFRSGKLVFQSILIFPDIHHHDYEGEIRYLDGDLKTQGIITFPNGMFYEGEIRNEIPHGIGVLTMPNGERYEGGWQDGKFIWEKY